MVIRTDDNGQTYLVSDGLSQDDAEAKVHDLYLKGHKQSYAVRCYNSEAERVALITRLNIIE